MLENAYVRPRSLSFFYFLLSTQCDLNIFLHFVKSCDDNQIKLHVHKNCPNIFLSLMRLLAACVVHVQLFLTICFAAFTDLLSLTACKSQSLNPTCCQEDQCMLKSLRILENKLKLALEAQTQRVTVFLLFPYNNNNSSSSSA